MKVGVTGASGYVGKKVVKELEANNHQVFKFVRREIKTDSEIYWSPSKQEIDVTKFQELDYCSKRFTRFSTIFWWPLE